MRRPGNDIESIVRHNPPFERQFKKFKELDEQTQLLAEKKALERMLDNLPEASVIDRASLKARKAKVEKELAEERIRKIERHVDCVAGCEIIMEEANSGWISVKDRLPENKIRVLMTMKHDNLKTVEEGMYVDNTWFWQNFPLQHWTVIAWKPWPKPWEGN